MKHLLVLFSLVLIVSCEDSDDNSSGINQIRIDLYPGTGAAAIGESSQAGRILDDFVLYKSFNIDNYKGCESILFCASLESSGINNNCYLELYNLTDGTVISNSTLISNETQPVWIESENLINDFPNKDIDLSLRIRSENDGADVLVFAAHLYVNF